MTAKTSNTIKVIIRSTDREADFTFKTDKIARKFLRDNGLNVRFFVKAEPADGVQTWKIAENAEGNKHAIEFFNRTDQKNAEKETASAAKAAKLSEAKAAAEAKKQTAAKKAEEAAALKKSKKAAEVEKETKVAKDRKAAKKSTKKQAEQPAEAPAAA